MTPVEPKWSDPVLPRNPDELPEELPRGAEIPPDLDPLADGILMQHQAEWLEDTSDLKLCEKGRRTGITFAEALDDTLIAAAKRSAGGDNVFYIGDTKDKGREFIGYVAHFARVVAKELATVEEFMFVDQREDGSSKEIAAYRVKFGSGFRVEALSSRPENIRGLQGIVVIDEAAFHKDVRELLDAVNALLIWGGKVRIISTHFGHLNPFNELIGRDLVRRTCFIVELRNVPFDQQREILFYIVDRLPRLVGGALDATGNGAYLAEKAAQRYGATVVEVKLSEAWYRTEMVAYTEAIGDRSFILPQDEDVLRDHQALSFINGIIKVPDDHEVKGADGFERHGDSAVAGALAHFASRADLEEYGYQSASSPDPADPVPMFEKPSTGGLMPAARGGLW